MTHEYKRFHHYGTDYHADFVVYVIRTEGRSEYLSEWLIPGSWDE